MLSRPATFWVRSAQWGPSPSRSSSTHILYDIIQHLSLISRGRHEELVVQVLCLLSLVYLFVLLLCIFKTEFDKSDFLFLKTKTWFRFFIMLTILANCVWGWTAQWVNTRQNIWWCVRTQKQRVLCVSSDTKVRGTVSVHSLSSGTETVSDLSWCQRRIENKIHSF